MSRVLETLRGGGSPYFVTQRGRTVAALLPIEIYDDLVSDLEDRLDERDAELGAELRRARRDYKAGKSVALAEVRRRLKI